VTLLEVMNNLRRAGDDCARIRESIDMRRDAVTAITAKYGDAGGHGGGDTDKMSAYAARVEQLQDKLDRRKRQWAWEMENCLEIADTLEGIERTILYSYYGKAWTLDAIAQSAGFTPSYVRKRKVSLDDMLRDMTVKDVPEWYTEA